MNLLLIRDNGGCQGDTPAGCGKNHYVYIKDFNRFMHNQSKYKIKNIFVCIVYNVSLLMKY